jgi:hypothetical protein
MKNLIILIVFTAVPTLSYLWAISEEAVRELSKKEVTIIGVIMVTFVILIVAHLFYLISKIKGGKESKKKILGHKTWSE